MYSCDFFGMASCQGNSAIRLRLWPEIVAGVLTILVYGCGPHADVEKRLNPAAQSTDNSLGVSLPEAEALCTTQMRLFVCRYGTGLDPKGEISHLPNHVQTLAEIHNRYVNEFTQRPGFGMERYHWQPSEWAELIVGGPTNLAPRGSVTERYSARDSFTADGHDRETHARRPKYNEEAETLSFPGETFNGVLERIWTLGEMHLVGLGKPHEPIVYLETGDDDPKTRHSKQGKHEAEDDPRQNKQDKSVDGGIGPTRNLDGFESAAIAEFEDGADVVAKTSTNNMRIVGAIRAQAGCLKCHNVGQNALLGAFTYSLSLKSFATELAHRLADLTDLPPDALESIHAIESIGGTVNRNLAQPGRPVSLVSLGGTKTRDADLKLLRPLASLKVLDVSCRKITDAGVKEIVAEHAQLEELNLSTTKITNASLKELGTLQHLRKLDLWTTDITNAGLAEFRTFPQLESLALGQSPLTDAGLKEIAGLKKLRVLTVFNMEGISDATLHYLKELKDLEDLNLARTKITDAGLQDLEQFVHLRSLDLSITNVTDAGLSHIKGLKQLRTLRLNGIKIAGPGLKELRELPNLQTLELSSNDITDDTLNVLGKLTQLETLDLAGSLITDRGLVTLRNFGQLRSLSLWGAKLTDSGLKELIEVQKLRVLDLGNTRITDAGLNALKELKQLQQLSLTDTKVTDLGVAELKKALPNCEIKRKSTLKLGL
jgi:internalin A